VCVLSVLFLCVLMWKRWRLPRQVRVYGREEVCVRMFVCVDLEALEGALVKCVCGRERERERERCEISSHS